MTAQNPGRPFATRASRMGWFGRKAAAGAAGDAPTGPATGSKLRSLSGSRGGDGGGDGGTVAPPAPNGSSAAAGAVSPPAPPPKRGGHMVQRSRANAGFMEDVVPPPSFGALPPGEPPPPYLRGPVLRLWLLKQALLARVNAAVFGSGGGADGDVGLAARYGFQAGDRGGARLAADALVADLTGGAGAHWLAGPDEAVALLHEATFENYNRWARMVGATPVYSVEGDPDRAAILASQHAAFEARQSAARAQLAPRPTTAASAASAAPPLAVAVAVGGDRGRAQSPPPGHGTASASSSVSVPQQAQPAAAAAAVNDSTGGSSDDGGSGGGPQTGGDAAPAASGDGASAHAHHRHHHGGGHHDKGSDGSGGGTPALKGGATAPAAAQPGSVPPFTVAQRKAAMAAAQGAAPPVAVELRMSTQPGSDTPSRLADLALWYCVRAEAANLRFMPELGAWLFHQMRFWAASGLPPPPPEELARCAPGGAAHDPDGSFFAKTTVAPLYALLKRLARKETDNTADGPAALVPCCRKRGRRRFLKNSVRPNYDDVNELFWRPACLGLNYHSCDPAHGVHTLTDAPKSFREHASWPAVALTFWRWLTLLAVAYHGCVEVGRGIVAAGGVNITGLLRLSPLPALAHAARCFQTLASMQLLLAAVAGWHALPWGSDAFGRDVAASGVSPFAAVKGLYALGWAGGLVLIGNAPALLGTDLTVIYLILVAAKVGTLALAGGALDVCGCACGARSGASPVTRLFRQLEGVYYVSPSPAVGALSGTGDVVLGPRYMRQPVARRAGYYAFWTLLLAVKLAFDLQTVTQTVRLSVTLQNAGRSLTYAPLWAGGSLLGLAHPLAQVGAWAVTTLLVLLDSYIAFSLGAPLVGYAVLAGDGLGSIRRRTGVKTAFTRGVGGWLAGGSGAASSTPLATQFLRKCLPLALARGADPNAVFRRVWDQFVMSLREGDLVCNEEQCLLLYSDAVVTGVPAALPLFMYAGRLRALIGRGHKIVRSADAAGSDAEFAARVAPDDVTREALAEVLAAVPPLLVAVVQSHSAVGHGDARAAEAVRDLFRPAHGQSLRHCVAGLLEADGDPVGTLKALAGQAATLCVEFERSSASTRLRGSPLLGAAVKLLRHLHRLWYPPHEEGGGGGDGFASDSGGGRGGSRGGGGGRHAVDPSFAGVTLETIAYAASRDDGSPRGELPPSPAGVGDAVVAVGGGGGGGGRSTSGPQPVPDSRTIPGLLRLLATPNEGSGRLDGDGGDPHLADLVEALRDAARRVFYLLTMERGDGVLAVTEAERRVTHFMNSLYMAQLPSVPSPLEMPSFSALTPHYAEAVLYRRRDFLGLVNVHGVSPLVYLKALHGREWANFLERLGASNEAEAWVASTDAQGAAISGEVEVRLWASHRGQTLGRTVHGLMEGVRAVRLLATLQLELEYAALEEAAKPPGCGLPRLTAEEIERDAALAGQWFAGERFQYVLACQRYFDHGEDDVKRRSDVDFLLLVHPLLSVAYYEASVSPVTGKRRLLSVCRTGAGVAYRLPCPGNPIADGIGEGKPENANNGLPFVRGRVVQTLDMNQEGYFEEALKLPNALSALGRRVPATGRPLVMLGLREHIYTSGLSAPAYFMAQQEHLFGTMFQRLMSSPLYVRMHYGHPDLFDRVWMASRGGTAKASAIVNVSEDIFAGYAVALRGGETGHAEYLQMGKGRDVGMLQIYVFEGKISSGTAISMTTRDTARLAEGLDCGRLASYYHTAGGFYISQALVVASFFTSLYYLAGLALSRLDAAIAGSRTIYLLGEVSFLQWWMQLGLTSLLPLAALHALEGGVLTAAWRLGHAVVTFAPAFYMFEIQTKAYHFDGALAFGRTAYAATGRDFVLRHAGFVENWSAVALSHLYPGAEALVLLGLATGWGTFRSPLEYAFFASAGWAFGLSLLTAPFLFNPFQLELKWVRADWAEWRRWLRAPLPPSALAAGAALPPPETGWRAWFEREVGRQYDQVNVGTRAWRAIRVSRLLLLVALLAGRMRAAAADPGAATLLFALYVGCGVALVIGLQLGAVAARALLPSSTAAASQSSAHRDDSAPAPPQPAHRENRCAARAAAGGAATAAWLGVALLAGVLVAGAGVLPSLLGPADVTDAALGFVAVWAAARWACCVVHIASCWPLGDGARCVHYATDVALGGALLTAQFVAALAVPLGSTLHTHLLFSRAFADTVAVVTGSNAMLQRQAAAVGGGAASGGGGFLNVSQLGELEFKRATRQQQPAHADGADGDPSAATARGGKGGGSGAAPPAPAPENRIGIRRLRLKSVAGGGGGGGGGDTPGGSGGAPGSPALPPMGGINRRAVWLQPWRTSEEPSSQAAAHGGTGAGGGGGGGGALSPHATAVLGGGGIAGLSIVVPPHGGGHHGNGHGHHRHGGGGGGGSLSPGGAGALSPSGAPGTPGPNGTPRVRKSVQQILAEHSSHRPATPTATSGAAAASGSGESRSGRRGGGGGGPLHPHAGPPRGGAGLRHVGGVSGGAGDSEGGKAGGVHPNFVIPQRKGGAGGGGGSRRTGPPRANTAGGKRAEASSAAAPVATVSDAIAALRNRLEHR